MKHKCSNCKNNLFEIITDKKHNEIWIVCSKCKRNSEIRIPIDKDEIQEYNKRISDAFKELKLVIKSIESIEQNDDVELVKKVCLEEIDKTKQEIFK